MGTGPDRRATIHDVARHAGVAVKTVSRVLNGERSVSDAMRARVQASIQALDYRPNAAARVLRKKVTRSIAYVCEDIAEPVQARLAGAIEAVAVGADIAMTVSVTHHDPHREQSAIESLLSRQVDGIVLWPTGVRSRFLERLGRIVPLVCVDRPIPGLETDTVFCDNQRGAQEGVGALVAAGHSRIAFVGDLPELFTQTERFEGYNHALSMAGLTIDERLVFRRQQGIAALAKQLAYWRMLPDPPTAIFAASSLSATTLVRALPSDVEPRAAIQIVGFDDFPLADIVRGGISVISQEVPTMGTAAAQAIFRRLSGDRTGFTHTRVPPNFIARNLSARAGR